ncbi:BON domain-containing protein [Stenotrophomonas aracearum]|jgi:hyperosmotically inducible protein|uniref:BON domain-containing protein n=1 Tax=Stenotrophomonas aracearum TaxID=3003272 RepID=A0ABY9YBC5_9GAMM|nr:BON domain-containing protein [Stenotrophomonas sp. A5588]WNH48178.1 BON domain-containing protein [Stenotrophomonas sp. A5588]
MTNTTRNLLAASLALGMLLGTSAAMAKDPPKTTDHSAMTHADKHDSAEPVTDTWITTKVKSDLLASSNVSGTDVKVETVNGVVSLSGTVATKAEHDKAVMTAKNIKGVKSVDSKALMVAGAAAKR